MAINKVNQWAIVSIIKFEFTLSIWTLKHDFLVITIPLVHT